MEIVRNINREKLDNFLKAGKNSQFLQAWQWGEFHSSLGESVWRLGVREGEELAAVMQIIKKELPMGKSYFYCGRGPIFKDEKWDAAAAEMLFSEAASLAAGEGAMFLRFDPPVTSEIVGREFEKTLDVQPSRTIIVDISRSEEEILKNMHQKTRYNINLAAKKGVKIISASAERLEDFWRLLAATSERDEFRTHGRYYYEGMLKIDPDFIKLFLAEYEGRVLAAAIVSFFGDSAFYLHGASANEDRNLMAPHLLHWEIIKSARARGFKNYDLFGIDEEKWPGVTKFKRGFGGAPAEYPGTFDLIFDSGWYSVYKMMRKVRRTF